MDEYPAELAVDLRSLFNISIMDIGETVSYKEAVYLISSLQYNPRSWLFAKLNQWEHPTTMEYLAILNIFDAFVAANSDPKKNKAKPHPRPFDNKPQSATGDDWNQVGKKQKRSREEVIAILNKMNPR